MDWDFFKYGTSMEWLTFGPNFMILAIQKSSQTQKMHFSAILAGKPPILKIIEKKN